MWNEQGDRSSENLVNFKCNTLGSGYIDRVGTRQKLTINPKWRYFRNNLLYEIGLGTKNREQKLTVFPKKRFIRCRYNRKRVYIGSCRPFWVKPLVATLQLEFVHWGRDLTRLRIFYSIWESGGCRRQHPPASPSRPVQRTSTAARGAVRRYALMHQSLQQLNSNRRWLSDLLLEESKESK